MINETTVFVSRFSTAIMKTLLLDPPAIYYDPCKEMQTTCLNEMSGFPTLTTKSQLKDALQDVLGNSEKYLNRAESF